MHTIPPELWRQILLLAPTSAILECALVSRTWCALAQSILWSDVRLSATTAPLFLASARTGIETTRVLRLADDVDATCSADILAKVRGVVLLEAGFGRAAGEEQRQVSGHSRDQELDSRDQGRNGAGEDSASVDARLSPPVRMNMTITYEVFERPHAYRFPFDALAAPGLAGASCYAFQRSSLTSSGLCRAESTAIENRLPIRSAPAECTDVRARHARAGPHRRCVGHFPLCSLLLVHLLPPPAAPRNTFLGHLETSAPLRPVPHISHDRPHDHSRPRTRAAVDRRSLHSPRAITLPRHGPCRP